jgi:hypothetical protein
MEFFLPQSKKYLHPGLKRWRKEVGQVVFKRDVISPQILFLEPELKKPNSKGPNKQISATHPKRKTKRWMVK